VRGAAKGVFFEDTIVAGFPISGWISLAEETYSIGSMGYNFNGWPDGLPLMEQEQVTVDILKIVLVEMIKDANDG
jgi:hypothetical protein